MIKIAHASSKEKCKTQLKGLRKARSKQKFADNQIDSNEKQRLLDARHYRSLADEVNIALWDYDKKQYPVMKYKYLRQILKDRKLELQNELNSIPFLTDEYSKEEKNLYILNRNEKLKILIEKIEKIQGEIK